MILDIRGLPVPPRAQWHHVSQAEALDTLGAFRFNRATKCSINVRLL
jgi:hypothetical protein